MCDTVSINNQAYKIGDILPVNIADCDDIDLGLVRKILVRGNLIFFVIQRYKSYRNEFQYFVAKKPKEDVYEIYDSKLLVDSKPLIVRGSLDRFVFTLHHYISCDYS